METRPYLSNPGFVQILAFLGAAESEKTRFLHLSKAEALAHAISPKLGHKLSPTDNSNGASARAWKATALQSVARKICYELSFTINPVELRRLVNELKGDDAAMASIFCFAAWINPVVPDYSDIGCYSESVAAHVYREAAMKMPKLILEATFGGPEAAASLKKFMAQWQLAEETVTTTDLVMLDNLHVKDRGPFLYWLVNERASSNVDFVRWYCSLSKVCACPSAVVPCACPIAFFSFAPYSTELLR